MLKLNNLSTRIKAVSLTIFITIIFAVLSEIDFLQILKIPLPFDFIKIFVLSFIYYIGLFWVLSFRIKGERFLTILLFPALSLFVLALYIELIINSIPDSVDKVFVRFIASMILAIFVYVSILTANILNVGFIEKIPLSQAGRASHYVLTLITNYLFISLLFSNSFLIYIKFLLVIIFTYIFTSIALWSINLRLKHRFLSSIAIALSVFIMTFVLSLWPVSSEYMAFILSIIYYIELGIALEVREIISTRIWIEYLLLYLGIILILFLIAEWGINGRII